MNFEFYNVLSLALAADYFNISYFREVGRGDGLNFLCKKTIVQGFLNVFRELGSEFGGSDFDDDDRYCWFHFNSEEDKNKIEEYFWQYNHANRINSLIAMPNLFEGSDKANSKVCNYYLAAIEEFIEANCRGAIAIPFGISEEDSNIRMFMVYDETRLIGLHEGPKIFNGNSIGFVN